MGDAKKGASRKQIISLLQSYFNNGDTAALELLKKIALEDTKVVA